MNFEEHAGKAILKQAGLPVLDGRLCRTPEEAKAAAAAIGAVVVKAQVPTGKRGKAGGIKLVDTPEEAESAARAILGMQIGDHPVERVLVEERAEIEHEFYAAFLSDADSKSPLVLFSTEGGMDIEEIASSRPHAIRRFSIDMHAGFTEADALGMVRELVPHGSNAIVARFLAELYALWAARDVDLVEVNPLALLRDGRLVALDCKLVVDDAALFRQSDIADAGSPERLTELERRGNELGLKFIELDGNVGILANGAGLTMTTMDVVAHFDGRPANFLEIGGEAYTKAKPALELLLAKPGMKSLIVNFCGAFARTDVMAEGVVQAWEELRPEVPLFVSIHGTGEDEAIALVRTRLGIEPFDHMEDAVKAAVEAAK